MSDTFGVCWKHKTQFVAEQGCPMCGPEPAANKPANRGCGCITCVCENEIQCQGCGSRECQYHHRIRIERDELRVRVTQLEAALSSNMHKLEFVESGLKNADVELKAATHVRNKLQDALKIVVAIADHQTVEFNIARAVLAACEPQEENPDA